MQRMAALVEVDRRMPADGVSPFEDVADRIHVDAPDLAQILLARAADNRDEPRDDGVDEGFAPRRDGFGLGFSGGSSAGRRIAAAVSGGQTEPLADVIAAGAEIVAREGIAHEAFVCARG